MVRTLLAVVVLCLPRAVWACSVCACDPSAGALAVERPAAGSVRLSLEDRMLSKEAADEGEKENRLSAKLQVSPASRLGLQVELPVFLARDHFVGGVRDDRAQGLGDVSVGARYDLFRAGGLVLRHVVAVSGSLKLPTGANARGTLDEHVQLGSGSYDVSGGVSYVGALFEDTWIFALAQVRLNGRNGRGFRYGNALFGSAGVRRGVFDDRLLLSAEAQVRSAGRDLAGVAADPDSGGKVLYATGGAAFAVSSQVLVRGEVQVPVARQLNGAQTEHAVAYLGIAYDWGM